MKIKNLKVYGLKEAIIRSGYPMQTGEPEDLDKILNPNNEITELSNKDYSRAKKLAKTPGNSGHCNYLIGVSVQFDLCYPQYWTKHLQRYHWFQYFSGQSLMHKLTSVKDIKANCNKYVLSDVTELVNEMIFCYNTFKTEDYPVIMDGIGITVQSKKDMFHYIISNCPMGYELWIPVTTNYLQLKNMVTQRKTHPLYDWREFIDWVHTLPLAEELIFI